MARSSGRTLINGSSPTDPITDTRPVAVATPGGADERSHLRTAAEPEQSAAPTAPAHEPREVCSSSSDRVSLYLSRLKAASRAQLEAARTTLDDARQLVEAQLQLKATEPDGA